LRRARSRRLGAIAHDTDSLAVAVDVEILAVLASLARPAISVRKPTHGEPANSRFGRAPAIKRSS